MDALTQKELPDVFDIAIDSLAGSVKILASKWAFFISFLVGSIDKPVTEIGSIDGNEIEFIGTDRL